MNRSDVYRKICRLLRLPPSKRITLGYFDVKQMRLIHEYILKTQGGRSGRADESSDNVPAIRV
jgi:hypothetical protein